MRALKTLLCFALLSGAAYAQPTLCVDTTDITFNYNIDGPVPPPVDVVLTHCAGSGLLSWTSGPQGDLAPSLSLVPPNGLITAGNSTTVTVSIDITGWPKGTHTGAIRFVNLSAGASIIVDVTLNVTDIAFSPGSTLTGEVNPKGDSDFLVFSVLEGMTLKLKVLPVSGAEKIKIRIYDELGAQVESWIAKTNKQRNKQFKLKSSGDFRIVVSGASGSTGAYRIETSRKLPGSAKSKLYIGVKPKGSKSFVKIDFGALPKAIVHINVFPEGSFTVPQVVENLEDPLGNFFVLGPYKSVLQYAVHLVSVPLEVSGIHQLRVDGMFKKNDRITVPIILFQPDPGEGEADMEVSPDPS